ncbi:MAG: FHA domain-containing protein [Bdellovibrionia bacterium]
MASSPLACLVRIRQGPYFRAHIAVGPEFVIGRAPDAQVPIVSNTISRHHIKVELLKDQVKITDLKTHNGTFVDGVRIEANRPILVQPVNRVKLGESEEEISFLPIPLPMEMMDGQRLKSNLQVSLMQAQREIEEAVRRSLEEEKKAVQAALQLEKEQVRLQLQNEGTERLRVADARGREIIEASQREGQIVIAKAKQEASRIQAEAFSSHMEKKRELEANIEKLKIEANHILGLAQSRAEAQGREIVDKAKNEAVTELQNAHLKGDMLLRSAQEQFEALTKEHAQTLGNYTESKRQLEHQIEVLNAEAKIILQAARSRAEEDAAKYANAARAQVKADIDATLHKAETILKSAQDKYQEIISSAERETALRLDRAEKNAAEITNRSVFEATALMQTTEKKAKTLLDDAWTGLQVELDERRRHSLDSIRVATIEEQETIINKFKSTIDQLRQTQQTLEPEVRARTADLHEMQKNRNGLLTEIDALNKHVIEKRHQLSAVESDLNKAQRAIEICEQAEARKRDAEVAVANLKAQAEAREKQAEATAELHKQQAVAREKEAEKAMEMHKAQAEARERDADAYVASLHTKTEEIKNEHKRALQVNIEELQADKEKKVLEFKNFEKKQSDDLMKMKLEGLEKLKRAIEDEERKYQETLGMRSLEVAKAVEARLLPAIQADLRKQNSDAQLGAMLGHIRAAVDQVMLKEKSSITAVTEGMGVDHAKVTEKRARVKKGVVWASATCALLLVIFGQTIFVKLRELAKNENYTEYLVAKRSAESIYTPVQSNDWRETYVGNILYLRNYYEAKVDPAYEKQWTLKLNDLEFLRSLKLTEDDMASVIGKEAAMIARLRELRDSLDAKYLDDGLAKMNDAEIQTVKEMGEIFKDSDAFDKFKTLERDFTVTFIKRRFGVEHRQPSGNK